MVILPLLLAVSARAVEVTVYNQNLGLVKDVRAFALKKGVNEVKLDDVAAQIDPTSVHFKSLSAPDGVSVLEQNFEYDLVNPQQLLQKYLGKEIELERYDALSDKKEVLKGTLLSTQGGRVLRGDDGKIYVDPPGNPILPQLPEGLETKPALLWRLDSRKTGSQDCEISYLTQGLSWSADYVLVADANDRAMDLNAWVTLNNSSGAAYKDAKLKLVAGDVHRAPRARPVYAEMKAMALNAAAPAPQFGEKAFFEYHLYTLNRPTTLRENETKQIELASAEKVPMEKTYTYQGALVGAGDFSDYTRSDPNYGLAENKKVWVMLRFKNSKSNNLGIPLPAGRIRVYKADSDGSLQFIGEDSIDHTPKDEQVKVRMGDAFDIVGERKRTDFQVDTRRRRLEESFEIRLRNHKDQDVTVSVVEPLYRWSAWKITEASQKWTKKDAQTADFEVRVPKDGEAAVTYTVRYSW